LITRDECLKILRGEKCSRDVVRHCLIVASLSRLIADNCLKAGIAVDPEIVECGGLLHDIGRSITHDIHHAVEGAKILGKYRLPAMVVKIVEDHIGAGIPIEEAIALGLPNKDFSQNSMEEKIVAYADKLIRGREVTSPEIAEKEIAKALGEGHPAAQRFREMRRLFSEIPGVSNLVSRAAV